MEQWVAGAGTILNKAFFHLVISSSRIFVISLLRHLAAPAFALVES